MVFRDKPAGDDVLYQALDTLYGSHDELYQCDPWLKAYYSLSNWNNVEEDGAPYDWGKEAKNANISEYSVKLTSNEVKFKKSLHT